MIDLSVLIKMNMRYALVFLLFLTFSIGCTKNKPRRGLYWGEFYTTDTLGAPITRYDHSITVDEPTESSVNINGFPLSKSGSRIKGEMGYTPAFPSASNILLDCRWKNKNGQYRIEGDFSAVGQTVSYFGTFIMGSY